MHNNMTPVGRLQGLPGECGGGGKVTQASDISPTIKRTLPQQLSRPRQTSRSARYKTFYRERNSDWRRGRSPGWRLKDQQHWPPMVEVRLAAVQVGLTGTGSGAWEDFKAASRSVVFCLSDQRKMTPFGNWNKDSHCDSDIGLSTKSEGSQTDFS